MLFHEIYGCYYRAVAEILKEAVENRVSSQKMKEIIARQAFSESFLTILPALTEEKWQLLYPAAASVQGKTELWQTPLKHVSSMPLTDLEKRWLKAICQDPRIRLFFPDTEGEKNAAWSSMEAFLKEVSPLFAQEDITVFDCYQDADPYEDDRYIAVFHKLLCAIRQHKKIKVTYTSPKGTFLQITCDPYQLEYSEKDDKFRVRVTSCRQASVLNVGRIESCEIIGDAYPVPHLSQKEEFYFMMELLDERNALERVLLHFAHLKKQAERIALDNNRYRIKIYYDKSDETEMVIRVLSFGPLVRVTEPASFVDLIKARLKQQKSCERQKR